MMMSLVVVTYMVRGSMTKALITVGLGLVLVTVCMDALSGRVRFTYGVATLRDGIGITNLPLIPLWVKVLQIPANLLSILILIFCFLGSYSISNNIFLTLSSLLSLESSAICSRGTDWIVLN
jgi:TctA family transporter